MVGGGIQNELLCRFTAGALGRPVWAGPVEASAIGNMLMQLVSSGYCEDLLSARKLSAASFPVLNYEPEEMELWNQAYFTFLDLALK